MDPGKGDGGADPQSSLQSGSGSPRSELGLGRFLEGAPGTLEITEPGLRWGEAARRARQQLDPEIFLQLRDRLRDRRLPHPKLPGRSGEGPRFDDPHERLHRSQTIHPILRRNERYRSALSAMPRENWPSLHASDRFADRGEKAMSTHEHPIVMPVRSAGAGSSRMTRAKAIASKPFRP